MARPVSRTLGREVTRHPERRVTVERLSSKSLQPSPVYNAGEPSSAAARLRS